MIKTAIILAGGLGTRLRAVVADLPKCMAPVAGNPFLFYVIESLLEQGVDHFIFSLGYKSELIIDYVNEKYPAINKQFSVEPEPLGTGGAIKRACGLSNAEQVLILNGDTLFKANLATLSAFHINTGSDCTLVLKPMQDFDRYGVVELRNNSSIRSFREKKHYHSGLINGGIYALRVPAFLELELPEKFSFEKEYLEVYTDNGKIYGIVQREYFIDIGIPEDFEKAQVELADRN